MMKASDTLLERAIRDGFDETAGAGVPRKALEAAAWVGCEDVFRFVAESLGSAGAAPTDYPNIGLYHQDLLPKPGGWSRPVFLEGVSPTEAGVRAGVLAVSGIRSSGPHGSGVNATIPGEPFGVLQLSPFEEPDGREGRVKAAGLSWLIAYDGSGRVLLDANGGIPCVGGGAEWDAERQRVADVAYSPLVHCGLFAVCCLNAASLGPLARLRPSGGAAGGETSRGDAYELEAGALLSALRREGRGDPAGMGPLMRRCSSLFFGKEVSE